MKVLIISPHPDDEVLGCGATIKKLTDGGVKVSIYLVGWGRETNGESKSPFKIFDTEICKRLNVDGYWSIAPPMDNAFDTTPFINIVLGIESFLGSIDKPDLIFTHSGCDLNIDHEIVNRAVVIACRPMTRFSSKKILAFDVLSSTEWYFGSKNRFNPNVFIEITEKELQTKIDAMKCYGTEVGKFPHPRSEEALIVQAKRYGMMANVLLAEGFELIRGIARI